MRDFAAEHDIDLAESWAYSDSASDLPMLRAVGNPVAVNPDEELAAVAGHEGWRVMRFEKLGRRMAIAGATLAAAAIGGSGTLLAARAARPRSDGAAPPCARNPRYRDPAQPLSRRASISAIAQLHRHDRVHRGVAAISTTSPSSPNRSCPQTDSPTRCRRPRAPTLQPRSSPGHDRQHDPEPPPDELGGCAGRHPHAAVLDLHQPAPTTRTRRRTRPGTSSSTMPTTNPIAEQEVDRDQPARSGSSRAIFEAAAVARPRRRSPPPPRRCRRPRRSAPCRPARPAPTSTASRGCSTSFRSDVRKLLAERFDESRSG